MFARVSCRRIATIARGFTDRTCNILASSQKRGFTNLVVPKASEGTKSYGWVAGSVLLAAAAAGLLPFYGIGSPAAHAESGQAPGLIAQVKALEIALAKRTNSAFVFIKPHAVNAAVVELVKDSFADAGIEITGEGELDHKSIDEQMLIDNHYGAIANKAMRVKPKDLSVTPKAEAAFENAYGVKWADQVADGKVFNAADACEHLKMTGNELGSTFDSIDKKLVVKFGGGFYCGKIGDIFVINAFYMAMRAKFTEPPAKIHYFTAQWDSSSLSWEDFRGKVLGATDPSTAAKGSLRREILDNWQHLGLSAKPFTGDNGVHASASPFEAMAERCNWLGETLESDGYGRTMLASGISKETITAWMQDPQVVVSANTKNSLFDTLEDTDAIVCLEKAKRLNDLNK
eukprot:CAMPEP_0196572314 /NCGR_PEP_ID=MMETSP1081-20130531/2385_1 /TAXON_ID=36882 /ORGANISM="Pyramimonas amylifera, Strain CCMP720" /LENGTH=401 /DNA_ID=CAMNT_0041889595 /DNA_START=95 /DNA_END=1300 /DNA_ORIENTATION=-